MRFLMNFEKNNNMQKKRNNRKRKKEKRKPVSRKQKIFIVAISLLAMALSCFCWIIGSVALAILISIISLAGIGTSLYAFYIDRASWGSLAGAFSFIISFTLSLNTLFSPKEQPDLPLVTKELVIRHELALTEIALLNKTVAELKEQLAGKDLPDYKQAVKQYVENGDYAKAIELVDTDAADSEAAERHIFKAKLLIAAYRFAEAEMHYRKAVEILPSLNNNFAMAGFYYDLNRFNEAEAYYNVCLAQARSEEDRANVLSNLGLVQWENRNYVNAEKSFTEALKIERELAEHNPQTYNSGVAVVLNNLGLLQRDIQKYAEAEKSFTEALKIDRELAEKDSQAYNPDVAGTLNSLGNLQADIQKYAEAEKSFTEALRIRRELAEHNPQAYNPDLAGTLNNLGTLQWNIQKYTEAEKSFTEALKILRNLAEKNPQAYNPDVATTLSNLGTLQRNIQKHEEAEKSHTEALKIRRELAEHNPQAYNPDIAMTLLNISILYFYSTPNKELSLQYANEAGDVLKKCNDTPYVRDLFDKVQQIKAEWKKKKQ
jgi:tetratricopeptide (TPR) repeat protein